MHYIKISIILIIFILINYNVTLFIDSYETIPREPLDDILIKKLPNMSKHRNIVDIVPALLIVFVILFKRPSINQIEDYTLCYMIIMLLRMFSISLTIMPSIACQYKRTQNIITGGCNDCMFSGHTSLVLLVLLILVTDYKFPKLICLLVGIMYSLLIISAHVHYSVDVLIAWYITFLVFICYKYNCVSLFRQTLI